MEVKSGVPMGTSVPHDAKKEDRKQEAFCVQPVFTEDISARQTLAQPADITNRGGEDGGKKQWKKRQREGREGEQKVKMGNVAEG